MTVERCTHYIDGLRYAIHRLRPGLMTELQIGGALEERQRSLCDTRRDVQLLQRFYHLLHLEVAAFTRIQMTDDPVARCLFKRRMRHGVDNIGPERLINSGLGRGQHRLDEDGLDALGKNTAQHFEGGRLAQCRAEEPGVQTGTVEAFTEFAGLRAPQ